MYRRYVMNKKNIILGLALILVGIVSLLNITLDIDLISFALLWPIVLFLIGFNLELKFFRDRSNGGNLIPGGILMVLGLIFFFQHITQREFSNYLSPFYLLALAVGFLQYYFLYKKDRGVLLIGSFFLIIFIVSLLSLLFKDLMPWLSMKIVFPLLLIIFGFLLIFKKSK